MVTLCTNNGPGSLGHIDLIVWSGEDFAKRCENRLGGRRVGRRWRAREGPSENTHYGDTVPPQDESALLLPRARSENLLTAGQVALFARD